MHCFLQRSLFIWHVLNVFHYNLSLLMLAVGCSLFSVILFAFNKANYIQNIVKVCTKFSFIKKIFCVLCVCALHCILCHFSKWDGMDVNIRSLKCPLVFVYCITCKTIDHKPNICSFSRHHTSTNYYNFTAI